MSDTQIHFKETTFHFKISFINNQERSAVQQLNFEFLSKMKNIKLFTFVAMLVSHNISCVHFH